MKLDPIASGKRKPVNLSLDTGVVEAAREAGINLSQTCEAALRAAAKAERERRWQEENRGAIEEWNAWVAEHGLPLAKYRQF
ncbi:antitoxin CcdA [Sphingobium sp. B2D3A]|uniref:type II toxin-antitoxin system CcdA family antitoxin n=1 Tax=unclassified Sphingobium TaxID=2611147 RepID=UPI0022244328|nr:MULTISPECIES: type II toxin-antitoxin system CcdA family antitoxin [unclassified Sphingobium]MCW2336404.1 antitoxin CcdA [Sphingobium sp. B2D3A]MCW2386158.1 antitoxin CcdA [Sphingobium sp. B2D3D]